MAPTPVRKSSQLFDRIIAAVTQGEPTEFQIKGFEREAQALLKESALEAYVLLGVLATHRKQEAMMREHFAAALRLAPNDLITRLNFATALSKFGYFDEAFEWMLKAHRADPLDLPVLESARNFACEAGAIFKAADLDKQLQKLESASVQDLDRIATVLKKAEVPEEDVMRVAQAVSEVIRKRGFVPSGVHCKVIADSLAFRYVVDAEPDAIAEINRDIAATLCARFEDPLDRAIIFACQAK